MKIEFNLKQALVKETIKSFNNFCNSDKCSLEDCKYHEPFDTREECIVAFTIDYFDKGDDKINE